MHTLTWTKEMELGHPRIDAEHRRLVELAAVIESAFESGKAPDRIQEHCRSFYRYLVTHCVYEERLLQILPRAAYGAQVDDHRRGHDRLIREARALSDGTLPSGYDSLKAFSSAYFDLLRDLLVDDSELIGVLIREGHLSLAPAGQPRPPAPNIAPPPATV